MSIVNNRYSTRVFNNKEVKREDILKMIEAGMAAPSSKNLKPWQFVVLDEEEVINKFQSFHKNWAVLKTANKVIIVCGDLLKDERETHTLMACSAVTENILIKGEELSLGTVWLGLYPDKERVNFTKEELNLPGNIIPISLIAIGNYDKKRDLNRAFDETIVHFNNW